MTRQQKNKMVRTGLSGGTGYRPFLPGLSVTETGLSLQVIADSKELSFLLFRRNEAEPFFQFPFQPEQREGLVWYGEIPYESFRHLISERELLKAEYCFRTEKGLTAAPFGLCFSGRDSFGKESQFGNPLRTPLFLPPFDWGDDRRPETAWTDTIIYRLNVRSFTKGASSGVVQKGTFEGIIEKIPYLKSLGITAVELMPCQEFEELMPLPRKRFYGAVAARVAAEPSVVAAEVPAEGPAAPAEEPAAASVDAASSAEPAKAPDSPAADKEVPAAVAGEVPAAAPAESSAAVSAASVSAPSGSRTVSRDHRDREPDPQEFRVNLWGYTKAFHFAPKASYCTRKQRSPSEEFRSLVRALHEAGIQVFVEFYFDGSEDASYVSQVLRHWVHFYHIDGIRLTGFADSSAVARDPYLADTRLITGSWDNAVSPLNKDRLAVSSDAFQNDMRRLLKGDEGMLGSLMFHSQDHPKQGASIHYMANTNSLTLMDLVSYDRKHNEANGEDNKDGTEQNFSWNCGEEGPTKKKKIKALRLQQLKNAILLLMLSQGTPLLLAGDEFGNSQAGNNNAWCQDNETGWIDWRALKRESALHGFVRDAIAFRKAHPVFRRNAPWTLLDPKATGMPDLSWHGERPWRPEYEPFRRQLGILYNGKYAESVPEIGKEEVPAVYVMYNFHWEPHEFHLPNTPGKTVWYLKVCTSEEFPSGGSFLPDGSEVLLADQRVFTMPPRSIAVLTAGPAKIS